MEHLQEHWERTGPTMEYIKRDIFNNLCTEYEVLPFSLFPLHHVALKHIIDSVFKTYPLQSFGPWRVYCRYGEYIFEKEFKEIREKYQWTIKKYGKSMNILRLLFAPVIKHYLYKPDGIRYRKIEKEFHFKKCQQNSTWI